MTSHHYRRAMRHAVIHYMRELRGRPDRRSGRERRVNEQLYRTWAGTRHHPDRRKS